MKSVDIVVDAASYASKNEKRNEHVIGSDFLDAANHPEIRFQASGVTAGPDGYSADGTITVKDTSAAVTVNISKVAVDGDRGSFTATATLDRMALGVDKTPMFVVARTLELTVSAVATASAASG